MRDSQAMLDAKGFLGRGWKFPVVIDPQRGDIAMAEHEEDIKEAIWIILSTSKGERVMRPNFGCGIHDLVFSVINTTTLGEVESNIRDALTDFEPRIDLLEVAAKADGETAGKLLVLIDYRVRDTNTRDNLVYPFYLKERG
jgi:phage baseplate assembly protein W